MTIRRCWPGASRRRVYSSAPRAEQQAKVQEAAGEAEVALAARGGAAAVAVHAAGNESASMLQADITLLGCMWHPLTFVPREPDSSDAGADRQTVAVMTRLLFKASADWVVTIDLKVQYKCRCNCWLNESSA